MTDLPEPPIDYPAFKTALEWNKGQTYSDSKTAFWEFLGMYLNQAKKRQPSPDLGGVCEHEYIGHNEGMPYCGKCGAVKLQRRESSVVDASEINREFAKRRAQNGLPEEGFSREIPVNRELLLTAIYTDIEDCTLGSGHPVPTKAIEDAAQSIMGTIEPFLEKLEPVSVAPAPADEHIDEGTLADEIDAVEAEEADYWRGYNRGWDLAKEDSAKAKEQPDELPANHMLLRAAIFADIDAECGGACQDTNAVSLAADSVMGTIAPFLAKPKRESIDPIIQHMKDTQPFITCVSESPDTWGSHVMLKFRLLKDSQRFHEMLVNLLHRKPTTEIEGQS